MAGRTRNNPDDRPIRILCLIKGLGRGGAELLLAEQVRADHDGRFAYEVAYLLPHKDALVADIESQGVTARCLGTGRPADPTWLVRLRRLLADQEIDVVHAHSPVSAAFARVVLLTIRRSRRPRMVTTEHNLWESHVRLTRLATSLTATGDDARLAVSSAVRASMPVRLQASTEVIRHGIDVEGVAAKRAERDAIRRELGLDGRLVVGTVANMRATKGWLDLLAAARLVVDEVEAATFVAVGQGPMEEEVRGLHEQLGLADRFRILGFRPDAVRVMAGFDVFCLASHHEGLPIAVMEAMAIGLPIVATDVGGLSELVVDGVHGRLVPPHRPDLLAGALVELLTDDERRDRAAASARSSSSSLSSEHSIRRVEAIYEALARS
ncbi:MAG TPA: glycosyltransferase [Acidimicrobiales bacterium]|nr:glycosyltransferase [Acidimicrobiales bacterium]